MTSTIIILTAIIILLVCIYIIYCQRKKIRHLTKELPTVKEIFASYRQTKELNDRYAKILEKAKAKLLEPGAYVWVKKDEVGAYIEMKLYDFKFWNRRVASLILIYKRNVHLVEDFYAVEERFGKMLVDQLLIEARRLGKVELSEGIGEECKESFLQSGGQQVLTPTAS